MWRKSVVAQSKREKKKKKKQGPRFESDGQPCSSKDFSGDFLGGRGHWPWTRPRTLTAVYSEGRRAEARRFVPTTRRLTTRCGPSDPASSCTALRPPVPGRARRPRVPRRGRRAAGGPRAPRCPAGPRRGAPRGAESSLRSSGVALQPPGSSPPARDLLVGSEGTDVHSQGHSAERQRG